MLIERPVLPRAPACSRVLPRAPCGGDASDSRDELIHREPRVAPRVGTGAGKNLPVSGRRMNFPPRLRDSIKSHIFGNPRFNEKR
jgi:hypothetical protein